MTELIPCNSLLAACMFLLCGCGSGGGGGSSSVPPPANEPPNFTSASETTVDELTTGTIYTISASDPDGDPVTFSINGGDAGFFTLNGSNLSFTDPPDFESPRDTNGDNIYLVDVTASDGTQSSTLTLQITVSDIVNEFAVRRLISGLGDHRPLFVELVWRDD